MMIDNVRVIIGSGPFSAEDAQYYIRQIQQATKLTLKTVRFNRCDSYLDIRCSFESVPFDRIWRIPLTASHEDRAVNK